MLTNQVSQDGEDLVVRLPAAVVAKLKLAAGDKLQFHETHDAFEIHSEFSWQLKIGRKIMAEQREVLSKLAKS